MSEKRKLESKEETRKQYKPEGTAEAYTESVILNEFIKETNSLAILPVCYATKNWKAFRHEIELLSKSRLTFRYFKVPYYWAIAAQDSNMEVLEILKEFKVPFEGCYDPKEKTNPLCLFENRFDFPNDRVRDWFQCSV